MHCEACNKCRPHPEVAGRCWYLGPYRYSHEKVVVTKEMIRENYPGFTEEQVKEMVRVIGIEPT